MSEGFELRLRPLPERLRNGYRGWRRFGLGRLAAVWAVLWMEWRR